MAVAAVAGAAGAAFNPVMLGVAGGLAVLQIGVSLYQQNELNKAKEEAIKAQRKAATLKFSSIESSTNLMKAANLENSLNMTGEALRAGAAKKGETKEAIVEATSTVSAASEGLTSGRSQGRQMVDVHVKGNKLLQKVDTQTRSMVNQITEAQDKMTNDLNNRLIGAHQDLTAVLANEGTELSSLPGALGAGISGFGQGMSIYNAFK